MSISVNGVTNTQGTQPSKGSATPVDENDSLFGAEQTSSTDKAQKNEQRTILETELAKYKAELKKLEAEKTVKEAYKKELTAQKRTVQAQKEAVESQIQANEEAIKNNEENISKNEQNIQKAQEDIEKLQKEYDAKTKEANELSQEISEKISKIIEDSENDVKIQQEQIKEALEEANKKAASGEIGEDEVAQYVMNKIGGVSISISTEDIASINSLNGQVKALIANTYTISDQMTAKQNLITSYQANIRTALDTNEALNKANEPLKKRVANYNSQIADVDSEIQATDKEINVIDGKISKVNVKIQTTQNQINSLDGKETQEVTYTDVPEITTPQNTEKTVTENKTEESQGTASEANPFLAVSYDLGIYSNMTEALEAMSRNNEQNIASARTISEDNKQTLRKMFQDLIG